MQPNQPGVLQLVVLLFVVVVFETLEVLVVVFEVVVLSSKQPHHPGVLQVSVLVRVLVELLDLLLVLSV